MAFSIVPARARRVPGMLVVIGILLLAPPARALRVVNWNILNYPGSSGPARAGYYRLVLGSINADVLVTEEMSSPTASAEFLNEVLDVLEPGQWAAAPFIDGNDTDAELFYKPAKVQFLGQGAFYPNAANHLRYVHTYRLLPAGYNSAAAVLRLYTAHLKASTGYESQRLAECTGIRDSMNTMPAGTHALVCGDMNFYTQSAEPGYGKFMESQANNTGRLYDMLPAGAWHDGAAFAPYHTQSTCLSGTCASGAATGGMDDRFDMILPTYSLGTGQGLSAIPGTCAAVGQDGQHFNKSITDAPTIPQGDLYATALKMTSDHLPVRVDLQLPAQILADASLVFDPVIVGAAPPTRSFGLNNPAAPPADSLNCTFVAPAGFGAPGPLALAAGGAAFPQVTMSTGAPGPQSGNLSIQSDAPDDPTTLVALSGAVLDHATASLDSTTALLASVVDFGAHAPGDFPVPTVRVFNPGYDPLHARLVVNGGAITGGGGRFSIVGGFAGKTIGGPGGGDYSVAFDDANALPDSTYTATLTFTDADEPLPGAEPLPDLVVSLSARMTGGTAGAGQPAMPAVTLLHPPAPNPLVGSTTLHLDLAREARGTIGVFDPAGRRVAMLREGALAAGRHTITWDGRSDTGSSLGSGIYFVRFSAQGMRTQVVRVTILR